MELLDHLAVQEPVDQLLIVKRRNEVIQEWELVFIIH